MKKHPEITMATKEKLKNTFWNLYCEKGISHVSVCQIVKEADVNRSTFYQYFCDIYDVLEQIENNLIDNLTNDINELIKKGRPKSLKSLSRECSDVFERYGDYLFYLLGSNGDPAFANKLKTSLKPLSLKLIGLDENLPHQDYIITFGFTSLVNLLTLWHEKNKDLPYEELINLIQTLISIGVLGLTNKKIFDEQL